MEENHIKLDVFISYSTKDKAIAKELENNKRLFIHHDIRPFDILDSDIKNFDFEFAKYIPWILEMSNSHH